MNHEDTAVAYPLTVTNESLSTKNIRAVSRLLTSLRESVHRCEEAVKRDIYCHVIKYHNL